MHILRTVCSAAYECSHSIFRLFLPLGRLAFVALLIAGFCTGAQAQAVLSPLTVANESPGGYNSDVYRWYDATGQQRTAVLTRNNAADPGGSRGGFLRQFRFKLPGGTERVVTGTGANGWNGWGYIVNHHDSTAYVSTGTTGTYRTVFAGRHHAIHEFKSTYAINGTNIAATIHWFFATGQDNPVYAITYDTSAAGAAGFTTDIDSRAPYGDMQFGGDGSNPNVSGVAWGDKYKFFSRDEPLTAQSRWDYSQPNTVPYVRMWITSPDAEMGAVQTQSWLQHNTGGTWFQDNWGLTSENRVGSTFGSWMMPVNWNWPYQLNQYEMNDTSPTTSKRCAWGLMYGAVGKTSYYGYGYENTYSGHPYQSYSVAMVIGRQSSGDVQAQVTRTERLLAASLSVTTGQIVTQGAGGAGRTDTVTYAKPGYNPTYGAFEIRADVNNAFSLSLNSTGAIKNPVFIIRNVTTAPTQFNLNGVALSADQNYYASYDATAQTLWLTVNQPWSGNQTLATGAGTAPTISVTVDPTTASLAPSATQTFTASVAGTSNQSVTWAVTEAGGGTVSASGLYTAPAATGTYHVTATSQADTTKSATATVTVAIPPPVISAFQASPALIDPGQSSTLSWTVTGATSLSLNQSIGAVTGTSRAVSPGATTTYTLTATNGGGSVTATANVEVLVPAATPTVTITANPANPHAISPWIYGVNFYEGLTNAPRNLTLNRQGGNRWTAYNWENNASNAGSDWGPYSNDTFLSSSTTPAEALRPLIVAERARGTASIITVQMQGYVSADTNGLVNINDPNHLATRFKQVVFKKGSAFTLTPSTTDANVYMDEFLWALDQKIPGEIYADPVTPTFLLLDNEPELWPSTHAEIQTGAPTVADYDLKTINLCKAIKDLAPTAKIFGPVHYGFNGIVNWQGAAGFSSTYWFIDKYLADLKAASQADGRRLLDVYDFHWYSEAQGDGTRIVDLNSPNLTATQVQAIVQSPRSLWDSTYRETSWVADYLGGPIRILDRLQQKIDAVWPGTGLSVTEYNNGGANHIAGAIAQADNLGVFGQQNIFAANFWPTADSPFILAGFKMYRDFDGALGTFGDTSIPTVSSDTAKVSAYLSRDSQNQNRYVVVAINRSTAAQTVAFNGLTLSGTARSFRLSGNSTTPVSVGSSSVDLATWRLALPALSVATIEITAADATPTAPSFTTQPLSRTVTVGSAVTFTAAATGSPTPTFQWKKDNVAISGATNASYTIASPVSGDAGSYTVVATNSVSAVTSDTAVLTVNSGPLITTQPLGATILTGASVTLTVVASGSPAPTYQWRKSGAAISGATSSSYTIFLATMNDAGSYSVEATNVAGAVTSNAAVLNVMPAEFDVAGYYARYPAVAAVYGADHYGAWLHYRNQGISNGEVFDDLFRVNEYLALYPELAAIFGPDLGGALEHWLTTGKFEGRLGRIPTGFSALGYFARNADVAAAVNNDAILAWEHFWLYGIYEGRAYDDEFRVFEYLALNADLQAAFLSDWRGATLHWLRYGWTEGRLGRIPLIFSSTEYLNRYPEVGLAWGTYPTTVWLHYWLYGIDEGRTFDELFRVDEYLALNPDLLAVFGSDRRGAFKHWVRYGQAEGRAGRNP